MKKVQQLPSLPSLLDSIHAVRRFVVGVSLVSMTACLPLVHAEGLPSGISEDWRVSVSDLVWVGYAPTGMNPHHGVAATPSAIHQDLAVLRKYGFTGLISYGAAGGLCQVLVAQAEAQHFKGLIIGVWDPTSREEVAAARSVAMSPIVLGYCVGNEGLEKRYSLEELERTIQELREATGKPVTTTEEIDDYADGKLLQLGDWVFPNAHPYWHAHRSPDVAVRWTQNAFNELQNRTDRFVWFKEVGLPTAGGPHSVLTETAQDEYYSDLAKTPVRFVYFEAFDQPWKTHEPVEPHWGLFRSDRSPKRFAQRLLNRKVNSDKSTAGSPDHENTSPAVVAKLGRHGTAAPTEEGDSIDATSVRSPSSIAQRVQAIIERMTLEEKLGQLTQQWGGRIEDTDPVTRKTKQDELYAAVREGKVGSLLGAHGAEYTNRLQRIAVEESRLGIPLILGNDVIHGYRTIFPIPLGEASMWDPALVQKAARVAAEEAAAAGTRWTFAPMVDICRDPRWGRIAEGSGEDPYLASVLAAARVRGFQGDDLAKPGTLLACPKHYVAYGAAEGGRDYNTTDVSEWTLREIYLPPFKAAVRAGAGSIMTAFNEISGVPATANRSTLTRILREEWSFDGFVVSDWTSITEMIAHGFAVDAADAAEKAILAGVDMDMCSFAYRTHLSDSIRLGKVSPRTVDQAVGRILRMKLLLGLFENPYVDPARERKITLSKKNRAIAREVARNSIVLLKNEGRLLPLSDRMKSVAVIGPLADNRKDPLGTWAALGKPEEVITVLEGIKERVPASTTVHYAKGCEIGGSDSAGFEEAVTIAKRSDVAILVVGESENMSGEAHSRSSLGLPGVQQELIKTVHASGIPVVVVLMNGRPLSIVWTAENVPAILETWHLGVECGHAIADILFGDHHPAGRLPVTFPRSVGQVPIYYNHKNTGRPPSKERYTSKYIDLPSTPLFPFGYGQSYTDFEYTNAKVTPSTITSRGRVEVSVEVKNTGDRNGDEVVQLYVRDLVGSTTRPVKELKGFQKISLKPGESRSVSFTLAREQLGFYNGQMEYVVEPGVFSVWVGPNSRDGLETHFEVIEN